MSIWTNGIGEGHLRKQMVAIDIKVRTQKELDLQVRMRGIC